MECSSYYLEPVCEDTAVCDMAGSDSSCSFDESANLINDCQDNLVSDVVNHNSWELFELGTQQTNEVAGREVTDVVVPDSDILEEMSINSEDRADFAQGAAQSEASSDLFSRIENFHFQHSEHLARIKAAGRAVTDTYIACESVEVFKEEEKLEVEELESDVVLTQCVPESEASSELFTPLQLARIKAVNDAYRAWNEEKEKEAFQAMILADLSITQYSGYGAFHANPLTPQVIEGLEPKVNGNHLIRNWLSNEENLFEITFYKPFTFYSDVLLFER